MTSLDEAANLKLILILQEMIRREIVIFGPTSHLAKVLMEGEAGMDDQMKKGVINEINEIQGTGPENEKGSNNKEQSMRRI